MRCGKAEKLMAAHTAGELREGEAKVLEAHLAGCARCREAFALYKTSFAALRESRRRQAPEGVMENFWADVRRQLPTTAPRGEALRGLAERLWSGWVPQLAGAVGVAAAAVVLVWMVFSGSPGRQERPGEGLVPPAPEAGRVVEPLAVAALAKGPRHPLQSPRFFVLPPLESRPGRRTESDIDVLNSASLGDRGTTYALPSARLVSVDE